MDSAAILVVLCALVSAYATAAFFVERRRLRRAEFERDMFAFEVLVLMGKRSAGYLDVYSPIERARRSEDSRGTNGG